MTDPHKAAVTESNAEFIAFVKSRQESAFKGLFSPSELDRLIALADERVMIEEHKLNIGQLSAGTKVFSRFGNTRFVEADGPDLSTALRSVVAKIGEGNVS